MGLKGISKVISPDLLHTLSSMGHGDTLVLADIHFPTAALCRKGPKEIRADGHNIPELLAAIMKLLPLDTYVKTPVALMAMTQHDIKEGLAVPPVWATYGKLIEEAEARPIRIEHVERFEFYERAKSAFAIVHTGETSKYGNIILTKGLVTY